MKETGRLLGIDVGKIRVGIARTDPMRMFSSPIGTFSPEDSFREISNQIKKEGPILGVVVGWPLTPQGKVTTATPLAEKYIKQLKHDFPDLPIFKMDERFSSKEALEILKESGVPKKKRNKKGRLDQAAAAVILQEFMEARPEI